MIHNLSESTLFSEEQLAWMNGFVYGLTGIRPEPSSDVSYSRVELVTEPNPGLVEDQDFPWHDSGLPIAERIDLAEGRPLDRKLMAAMAQLDCGSCGYICQSYSEAIAAGEEPNLTLCSPGGKETKQMIKKLLKAGDTNRVTKPNRSTESKKTGWSRQNPYPAKLIESRWLNKKGSAKETHHIVIDLSRSGIKYEVGDALGVYPTNCPELVSMIIRRLATDPESFVTTPLGTRKSLAQALLEDCCLKDPSDELLELLINRVRSNEEKQALKDLIDRGVPEGCDVLDVLKLAADARVTSTEIVETLDPLNSRLYSIASSMKQVGNEVHLTVGKVIYQREGRLRKGVASTMLAQRVYPGERLRVFVQSNHCGFTIPRNTESPMIMVGPGTGIAPFVAFLQERSATGAAGKNWLFFGDQHEATDFLYQETLHRYIEDGLLSRLDTAFSRDGDEKVYVQNRMRDNAAELWRWLQEGAYFFVCGDASRMAKDVHQTLIEIVTQQGGMSPEEAIAYIENLADNKRYVRDVY